MKRKTAKEILAESFRELAAKKSIDKITIREITDNCGYSPATFYRHYKDKYDLIAWDYARGTDEIMMRIGTEYPWKMTLLAGAERFQKEKDYLTNLLLHTGGHDAFVRQMTEINHKALKAYVQKVNGGLEPDEITEMYIRLYCLGTVSLSCEWIMGRYDVSAEQLADVYYRSLPEPLHQYLL